MPKTLALIFRLQILEGDDVELEDLEEGFFIDQDLASVVHVGEQDLQALLEDAVGGLRLVITVLRKHLDSDVDDVEFIFPRALHQLIGHSIV